MSQLHFDRRRDDPGPGDASEPPAPAAPAAQNLERDAALDSLLDEIDGVLETNAQEFVHNFVQKGGQ